MLHECKDSSGQVRIDGRGFLYRVAILSIKLTNRQLFCHTRIIIGIRNMSNRTD